MGRERYRRLPRTILGTFVAFFILFRLFECATWLRRQKEEYRWMAASSSVSRKDADSAEQTLATEAHTFHERYREMLTWASEAEAAGEPAGADAWRAKADRKKRDADSLASQAAQFAKLRSYHTTLEQKYRWAMAHPWQSVPPDPPVPTPYGNESRTVHLAGLCVLNWVVRLSGLCRIPRVAKAPHSRLSLRESSVLTVVRLLARVRRRNRGVSFASDPWLHDARSTHATTQLSRSERRLWPLNLHCQSPQRPIRRSRDAK
jgi:hypothetical protein